MSVTTKLVTLKYGDKSTTGQIDVITYDEAERFKRTAKFIGISFLITIGFVFIPILHFVLVPLGLVSTIGVGIFTFKQSGRISGGKGTCPSCNKPFKIAAATLNFPTLDLCTECQQRVEIDLVKVNTPVTE